MRDWPEFFNSRIAEIVSDEYSRLKLLGFKGMNIFEVMVVEKFAFEYSAIFCLLVGKRFWSVTSGTEKVGSDSGDESCSILYISKTDGGSCFNKKNRSRRNTISMYIPVTNSFAWSPSLGARVFRDQVGSLKLADCRPPNWRPAAARGSPTSMPRMLVGDPEPTPLGQLGQRTPAAAL